MKDRNFRGGVAEVIERSGHLLQVCKRLFMALYDLVAVSSAYFMALLLRFDFEYSKIPEGYLDTYISYLPFFLLICLVVFYLFRLYKSLWHFASIEEMLRIAAATCVTAVVYPLGLMAFGQNMPRSIYFIGPVLQFLALFIPRFSYRVMNFFSQRRSVMKPGSSRVMIIGAGKAAVALIRLMYREKANVRPVCLIDDDRSKWGRTLEGVPVAGGREEILKAAKDYQVDEIIFAIPSASPQGKRDLLAICQETGCRLKNLPPLEQLVNCDLKLESVRDVSVEDLLGREPIRIELDEVFDQIQGKTILVTGGGGSIGSELCRQIAKHRPERLIIFDIYENNAYAIQLELKDRHPELDLKVLIGSVRDSRRLEQIMKKYHPDIVYHAAAHKHVPLMEDSPAEAVKNNVIGTYKTAYAAMKNGCGRFVLISTDKAVNPTNIMGASKRVCEMIVQTFDRMEKEGRAAEISPLFTHGVTDLEKAERLTPEGCHCEFVAVRFGNVLGSNGSVIPVFKKQIEARKPVTVTHPDIIRYFMTIPEAVSLVLQAGGMAKGGEIFVLDMGSPVKIVDLAKNLIRLSGLEPDVDIPIVYTGLRPGEKLYEEKLMAEEGLEKTANDKIFIGKPIEFDREQFMSELRKLLKLCYTDEDKVREKVAEITGTYRIDP